MTKRLRWKCVLLILAAGTTLVGGMGTCLETNAQRAIVNIVVNNRV